ncbi:hypothetical protein JOQ06_007671, partial [Pogonophryne albipinna]
PHYLTCPSVTLFLPRTLKSPVRGVISEAVQSQYFSRLCVKPSSRKQSQKLRCENTIPDQIFAGGENTSLKLETFKGVCFKDENQKSQKLMGFKGAVEGWQTALGGPNPLPCQA